MPKFKYAFVAVGEVEAPDEAHAKTQVQMGVSISARLLRTPNEIVIRIEPVAEAEGQDGSQPAKKGLGAWLRRGAGT